MQLTKIRKIKSRLLYLVIIILFYLGLPIISFAQDQQTFSAEPSALSDPPDPNGPVDPNDVPIDGGLVFLLAVGAAYCVLNHLRQKKNSGAYVQ